MIVPKENQSLEEAEQLLLAEIEKVKNGDFPDWLIPAIINDMKLQKIRNLETADGLATALYGIFINDRTWEEELSEIEKFEKITKQEVVDFAQKFFQKNYVIVKKLRGENKNLIRVENPGITPVKINREAQSEFLTEILHQKSSEITPKFND